MGHPMSAAILRCVSRGAHRPRPTPRPPRTRSRVGWVWCPPLPCPACPSVSYNSYSPVVVPILPCPAPTALVGTWPAHRSGTSRSMAGHMAGASVHGRHRLVRAGLGATSNLP